MDKRKALYLNEGLSLEAIADRPGVSKQAVHSRLTTATVKFRVRGFAPSVITQDMLIDLYITKRLTAIQVAKELGVSSLRRNAMLN